jgi:DNA polymerase III subunit alpha
MWVPLHVHSQYSVLDALSSVQDLAAKAAEYNMPAVALTDHGNMFGAVDFFKACKKHDVKPIIGCEVYVAPTSRLEKRKIAGEKQAYHLVLLAKNNVGYRNLCKLSSVGYLEGFYYRPRIDKELLKKHSEGLVCLSACASGRVFVYGAAGEIEGMEKEALWYRELFGDDYYLEVQRHNMTQEEIETDGMLQESWVYNQHQDFIEMQDRGNAAIIELSKKHNIPLVATNDSHYIDRDNWKAHELLINIQSGEPCEVWEKDSLGHNKRRIPNPKRRTYSSHTMDFKTPERMAELFPELPEALQNTLEVANKCDVELDFKKKNYPVYWPEHLNREETKDKKRKEEVVALLKRLCEEGISRRYTQERLDVVQQVYPDKEPMEVVRSRLEEEMGIIVSKDLTDYILIVFDFINWAKKNDVPVGPGRGSGAGSIILYLVGITDIEPLRFNLFFERFINPERMSYPDIDVDICMERRYRVAEYVLKKYGKECVAQIITFGTMKAKMAVKDVGRVLSVPLVKVNEIAKLIPEDLKITIPKALVVDPDLRKMYEEDEETHRVIDMAQVLEGSIRNTGIHAAGMIICGDPIVNHIPICSSKDAELAATQYSMKPVEAVGMLKVDMLGLKTLTCIRYVVNAVKHNHDIDEDWENLPLDDRKTFELLSSGKTSGVFQLESGGMQDLARNMHLDKFEEIIAAISLYRPGPMEMIPSYVDRKFGRETIEYDHPWMEDILKETYGIMVYQEQVMQIASKLANYSLGEGDVLRNAMGKKDMEEMVKQRGKFRDGAFANGIDEVTATKIFDKMEKFAAYGFNKSHAAAYGYISYVTAYFKAHYPKEWMAALLTCDRDDITKVSKLINDAQNMNIAILPPDVNEANEYFTATQAGIRFAMAGIKGVGEGVVEAIVEERTKNGKYKDLYDFIERIASKRVGKKAVENLVWAGCFDFAEWSRDSMVLSIESMFDVTDKKRKENAAGVMTLFSLMGEDEGRKRFCNPPEIQTPTPQNRLLAYEKELLGFYLTGHPLETYVSVMKQLYCVPLTSMIERGPGTVGRVCFIIDTMKVRFSSRTQRKFVILLIDDGKEKYELPVWPDLYEQNNSIIQEGRLLYAVLQVESTEPEVRLSSRWLCDLSQVNETIIMECDKACDRSKLQWKRFNMQKKNKTKVKEQVEKKETGPLTLVLDADKTRFIHVLQIKKCLRDHPGEIPVNIEFHSGNKKVASIVVDEQWGIDSREAVKSKLSKVPVTLKVN